MAECEVRDGGANDGGSQGVKHGVRARYWSLTCVDGVKWGLADLLAER